MKEKYILKHWKLTSKTDDGLTLTVRVAYNHKHNHLMILEGQILNNEEESYLKKPAKLQLYKLPSLKKVNYYERSKKCLHQC